MQHYSRRRALGLAGRLALAGAAGLVVPASIVRAGAPLTLPAAPMLFRKRIERSLRGGAQLVVTREWQLQFARSGSGISIVGEQIAVSVDAPAVLERLAQLEQDRSTEAMWPILLSDTGQIMAAGQNTVESDVDRAITIASDMIERLPAPISEREARLQRLASFERAGTQVMESMPADLFYPSARPVHVVRSLALPDGLVGEYEVTYTSRACPEAGLLERAERQVVTRIGGSEKRAREEWVLEPA